MERSPWNISYFFPSWDSGFFWGGGSFFCAPGDGRESRSAAALSFYHSSPQTQQAEPAQTKETGMKKILVWALELSLEWNSTVSTDSWHFFFLPVDAGRTGPTGVSSALPWANATRPGRKRPAVSLAFWGVWGGEPAPSSQHTGKGRAYGERTWRGPEGPNPDTGPRRRPQPPAGHAARLGTPETPALTQALAPRCPPTPPARDVFLFGSTTAGTTGVG